MYYINYNNFSYFFLIKKNILIIKIVTIVKYFGYHEV